MNLNIFLFLVPVLTITSALVLYRFTGKRQLFKLDFIQFFYAFILAPVFFIWAKTLLFTLIRSEIDLRLSQNEIFLIDTIFSTFLLYIFAFVVIHSLTKTFNLQTYSDPLYDIFHHSEYFHLWLTHLVMYGGLMTLITFFSIANIIFPIEIEMSKSAFYIICGSGVFVGIASFMAILLSDPKQARNFMRVMKLLFGLFFIVHMIIYFIANPSFKPEYALYWWSTFVFATMVAWALFARRSSKANNFLENISEKFKHGEWDFRVQLFQQKK